MDKPTPTVPPPGSDDLSSALRRNIQALEDRRKQEVAAAPTEARVAGAITRFTGSMRFVYLHLALFGFWIVVNLGWVPGVPAWDRSCPGSPSMREYVPMMPPSRSATAPLSPRQSELPPVANVPSGMSPGPSSFTTR